jgi:hypothetical protein
MGALMAISPESRRLWEEVKANGARKDACPRHHFTYETVQFGQPIRCDNCGGTMQLTDAGMYVKGYIAAGGNPDDVWPGWLKKSSKG